MKNILLLCFGCFFTVIGFAQIPLDSLSCKFETDCPLLRSKSDTSIWEVGVPNKDVISEAYSPTKCLITDVSSPVGINQTEYVQFDVPLIYADYLMPNIVEVSFMYQVDLTDGADGCAILLAFDSSEYKNYAYWSVFENTEYYYGIGGYIDDYSTFAADTGFTGVADWQLGSIIIQFNISEEPIAEAEEVWVDTLHIRFQLNTDSIGEAGDGLAIDNFLFATYVTSAISDIALRPQLNISPNPAGEMCRLQNDLLQGACADLSVRSIGGQSYTANKALCFDETGKAEFDTQQLPPGAYVFTIVEDDKVYQGVLVKQ